jgi:UDP-GlcNAc:undecaprenyl-phosphate/decaprenyl-phosphate GlcNAc-1-phosphate transferase
MISSITIYSVIIFIIIFSLTKISYNYNLVDIPNKRKKHFKPTAYIGGLAISISLIISIQLFDVVGDNLNLILSIGFMMAIVGFIDDRFKLNIGGKLSLQIIPIFYLIVIENISLAQLGDYNQFQLKLNSFTVPFTLMCVLLLINAFNYFDGLDGTLSLSSISTLTILYFLVPSENIKLLIMIIILPIFIFLIFNFSLFNLPKLFLGDSGSLLLGFIISFILIDIANQNLVHPILLAWSIAIFVYEFLAINLQRLKNKKNLFTPGLDHLHHIIFKKTKSIFFTNFSISTANIIFFIVGYLSFRFINPLTSLILFIIFFIIFILLRQKLLDFK